MHVLCFDLHCTTRGELQENFIQDVSLHFKLDFYDIPRYLLDTCSRYVQGISEDPLPV